MQTKQKDGKLTHDGGSRGHAEDGNTVLLLFGSDVAKWIRRYGLRAVPF